MGSNENLGSGVEFEMFTENFQMRTMEMWTFSAEVAASYLALYHFCRHTRVCRIVNTRLFVGRDG